MNYETSLKQHMISQALHLINGLKIKRKPQTWMQKWWMLYLC